MMLSLLVTVGLFVLLSWFIARVYRSSRQANFLVTPSTFLVGLAEAMVIGAFLYASTTTPEIGSVMMHHIVHFTIPDPAYAREYSISSQVMWGGFFLISLALIVNLVKSGPLWALPQLMFQFILGLPMLFVGFWLFSRIRDMLPAPEGDTLI